MATKSTPSTPEFPKLNTEAVLGLYKSNFDTLIQAQQIMFDTLQAVSKTHLSWVEETVNAQRDAFFKFDSTKKPEAYVADAQQATEKAFTVARTEFDLGVKAQTEVAELLAKRVQASVEEAQKIAV